MSWEERKAEAPEAGGGPRAWNVFVSVSVRPRKEERVSKIGTVSVSNQEPAVSTGNDWLASSAPGPWGSVPRAGRSGRGEPGSAAGAAGRLASSAEGPGSAPGARGPV